MTSSVDAWAEFRREIDRRLDELRPPRADTGDRTWREPVYGWARNHLPDETNVVRKFAKDEVDRRETEATKSGNKIVREWMKGWRPLHWHDLGPKPIKVTETLRVRSDAATPDDFDDAAQLIITAGKRTFDEVMLLGEGMHDIARLARRAGHAYVALLGDLPSRGGDPRPEDDVDPFDDGDEGE